MTAEAPPRRKKRKKRVPRMIDWYRVDTTDRIKQVLAMAAGLVLCGSVIGAICIALMRDPGQPLFGRPARYAMFRTPASTPATPDDGTADLVLGLGILALALVVSGGGTAVLGLMRELSQERWLALRTDGLVIAKAGEEKRIPWAKIEDVQMVGSTIVVTTASGDTCTIRDRFAGTTRAELGKRIAQVRRRVLLGLLPRA